MSPVSLYASNVRLIPPTHVTRGPAPRPAPDTIGVLSQAVLVWEDADIRLRSGECDPNGCLCRDRDEPDHEHARCWDCEQLLAHRADDARCEVVEAVVGAGLAADVAAEASK